MERMRNDNVLIDLTEQTEETTPSGIILPQTRAVEGDAVLATVLAVDPEGGYRLQNGRGPLVRNEVRVGDRVLVLPTAGDTRQDFGLDHYVERGNAGTRFGSRRIVREEEILAVVEP